MRKPALYWIVLEVLASSAIHRPTSASFRPSSDSEIELLQAVVGIAVSPSFTENRCCIASCLAVSD
jgi:hypothetical protein